MQCTATTRFSDRNRYQITAHLKRKSIIMFMLGFVACFSFPARAAVYYIGGKNCQDLGPGSINQPWCTLQNLTNRPQAGDRVVVRGGTYQERLQIAVSGTAEHPIIIEPETNGRVVIDGGNIPLDEEGLVQLNNVKWVTLRGLTVQNSTYYCLMAQGVSGVVVEQMVIDNCQHGGMIFHSQSTDLRVLANEVRKTNQCGADCGIQEAITISNCSQFLVEGNTVVDGTKEGIDVKDGSIDGEVSNNTVANMGKVGIYLNHATKINVHHNNINNCGYSGIQLAIGDFALGLPVTAQNRVYQNIIWNCQYDGLQFWSTTAGTMSNNQIINNVFYNNSHYGLLIENASNNLIANNIIAWNQLGSISGNAVWDNQISNNLFFHSGEVVGNAAVEGDPLFIDPGKADFHLTAGSPAIDRGINVGLPANGVPDLGAYEFGEDTSGGCSCMVPQEVASFDGWGWVAGSLMVIGFGMSYRYILLRRRRGKNKHPSANIKIVSKSL